MTLGDAMGVNFAINIPVGRWIEQQQAIAAIETGICHELINVRLGHAVPPIERIGRQRLPLGVDYGEHLTLATDEDVRAGTEHTAPADLARAPFPEAILESALGNDLKSQRGEGSAGLHCDITLKQFVHWKEEGNSLGLTRIRMGLLPMLPEQQPCERQQGAPAPVGAVDPNLGPWELAAIHIPHIGEQEAKLGQLALRLLRPSMTRKQDHARFHDTKQRRIRIQHVEPASQPVGPDGVDRELPHDVQPAAQGAQIVLLRTVLAGQPVPDLSEQAIGKLGDEEIEQRLRLMRHRRSVANRQAEPQRHVQHMDQTPAHGAGGFIGGGRIDLGQDFQTAAPAGNDADHLPRGEVAVMVREDRRSLDTAAGMTARGLQQGIGLTAQEYAILANDDTAPFADRVVSHSCTSGGIAAAWPISRA